MNKKVLVTGGGGYIGTILTNRLLKNGYTVTVLDNFIKGNFLPKSTKIFKGNILNKDILKQAIKGNKFIIHLAGISDGRAGRKNPELTKKVNVDTFKTLIDIAATSDVKTFLNMSTFGVYGNNYNCELTEDLPVNPTEPYSESKAETEIIANSYSSSFFTTINIRLAMAFGWSPQMRFDFLVNTMIKYAIDKKELTIFGGKQRRPQINIEDATNYLTQIIEANKQKVNKQTFNLGTINPSVIEIAREISKTATFNIKINYLPEKELENSFVLNSEKLFNIIKKNKIKNISYAYHKINKHYGVD